MQKDMTGISKVSSKSVYITATTDCYEKCDTVVAEVNLQRLEGNTWAYVTTRSKTGSNTGSVKVSDTVSVKSGYYYRVVSFTVLPKMENVKLVLRQASAFMLVNCP